MFRYAIIGFGGLGKTHFKNLLKIEEMRKDISLVAICNSDLNTLSDSLNINLGNVEMNFTDFSRFNLYIDYKEMIEKENLDFVFITLPTYLHCEVVTYALSHGIHVYCEKPMALTKSQCEQMMLAAGKCNARLMIGQCLRFTDEYIECKKMVNSKIYGEVISAEFSRKSPLPRWSSENWLLDRNKSGGCVIDMHVHDTDVINWMFGMPNSVESYVTNSKAEFESIHTIYNYDDKVITATANWALPSTFAFSCKFNILFENVYVECDNGNLMVYTEEEKKEIIFEKEDCFYREVYEFIDVIINKSTFETASIESVFNSMMITFAEIESVECNEKIMV